MRPRVYCGNEINIICDEHSLAAYVAAYYLSVRKAEDRGCINIITETGLRNRDIYEQANEEFADNGSINFYSDIEEYKNAEHSEASRRFYYFANLQLDEYKDEQFVENKKESLSKWLELAREIDGRFLFVPIFNFANPFDGGIAACSEREVEAVFL